MADLDGKIALIIGVSSGIGFGTANRMVEEVAFSTQQLTFGERVN
ncbi:hypothetical protein [Microbacterium sp. cf046]|nr:hypothetical protein [Microbacterium sp. cf046]